MASFAAAANSLPKYTYYYQKKEVFGKFLIQTSQNKDGTITIIEARTSLSKIAAGIPTFPVELIENAYGPGNYTDNIVITNDLNDLDFKEFLNTLNPIIKLPVEKNMNRYFTRALIATTDEIDAKESTDMEFPQNIGLSRNQEEFPPFFEAIDIDKLKPINKNNPRSASRPNKYKLDDIKPKYIETTLDDIIKRSNRLVPIIIQTPPENIKAFQLAYTPILNRKLYDENSATTTNILEMINDKFAEHVYFSYPFFKNNINIINANVSNIHKSPAPKSFAPKSLLDTINVDDPNFIIINFLRSYIDLYHDVLHHGEPYCKKLKEDFRNKLTDDVNIAYYDNWIEKIDTKVSGIFTKSGKISQSQCKKLIEELADEFINMLHDGKIGMKEEVRAAAEGAAAEGAAAEGAAAVIRASYTLIPKNKENANIISASTDNPAELQELFNTMKEDGINGFFVESIDNNFGTKLLHSGFDLCSLTIGEWDAGSGYKGGKEIINKRILIGPADTIGPLGEKCIIEHNKKTRVAAHAVAVAGPEPPVLTLTKVDIPNEPINIFDTINITVSPDNKILNVKYGAAAGAGAAGAAGGTFNIHGPQELSLNSIFKTTDNKIIRGLQEKRVDIITTVPQLTPASAIDLKTPLIALKTWTDLIQIVTISKSMTRLLNINPLKILTVINDNLCETTARMYGLGHVLKSQNKIVTYYNYNINSRNLTEEQLVKKMKLKQFITMYKEMFEDYITKWFDQRIRALTDIHETFYDPVMYFISELFKDIYENAKLKALKILSEISTTDEKLIPNSIDEYIESITSSAALLGDLLNYVSKFNLAIEIITKLNSRLPIVSFFEAYDYVEQQISNTFKKADSPTLRAMIASTFAYVFIKQYNSSRYTLMLEGFKGSPFAIEKRLNDINDIIIAYNTLSELPQLTNKNGNVVLNTSSHHMDIITYTYYIIEIVNRPLIKIQKQWSFSNIIKSVKTAQVKPVESGAANAIMTVNSTLKRKHSNTNNPNTNNPNTNNPNTTNSRTKARLQGGMKTCNNRKRKYRKHRTHKRKNKKRRTHKKK